MKINNIRTLYYLGILLLVLNAFPVSQDYLSVFFGFELIKGITVITVIATLTGVGAFMAYQRRYI